ncbi:polysaccharide pyruvyl transferase family protein [Woeseia oceani]|uniref:Polysaccharide pyruvyl transferase domain-containing protein n=1 Tax=Woeseia oceani TaxID=1548547 RepID=A0A193LDJ4_9GAMM|nr:polysaccharide pyruvyl transferase family protein [Woeseia oceani]ANO50454.1 hypothetical protein BA177_03840 [Woeseia oceani]
MSSAVKKYTVLSTYPGHRSSANVGDHLISVALEKLVRREQGNVEFLSIFREDPLDDYIDEINRTAAILLPAFPIRDGIPLYPGCYRLTDNLDRIKVPMVPVGANWNVYPGDAYSRKTTQYSQETTRFLHRVASGISQFSCREYLLMDVLRKHGIENTVMTGDPSWYDPDFFGTPIHRPSHIDTLVFSPPLSAFYGDLAVQCLDLLKDMFPDATRYCAFHLTDPAASPFDDKSMTNDASMRPDVARKNAMIRAYAAEAGYEVLEMAGDSKKLDFYRDCDLHVGFECHAHLSFIRQRRPSVLISEDARGVGFNYTLGVGGFDGFVRLEDTEVRPPKEGGTSGYCVSQEEWDVAPAKDDLAQELRSFLEEELQSGFRRYIGLTDRIDETYEKVMAPFLRSLP